MRLKSADISIVKAAGTPGGEDLAEGQFEAIVSVFGNVDSYGDVVMPGAFKADLERWEQSGDPIPVIFSHDWGNIRSHAGSVLKAEERPQGLWIRAQIEDRDINPDAELLYRKIKGRRVKQFSFAYDVLDGALAERDGQQVYELRSLKLHEVGPCLLGVNQETELLTVKARQIAEDAKAGRELSQKNLDRIVSAYDALGEVITSATTPKSQTSDSPESAEQTDVPSQVDESQPDEGQEAESEARKSAPRRARAVARIINLS